LVVQSQEDRALYADAVIMITLHPFFNIIRRVINSLIHIPCAGAGGEFQHFGIVFNRVADPLFFEGDHFPEQIRFPLFILRQRVVHNKETVVIDSRKFLNHFVEGAGAE